jgi:hypothetical protein
MGCRCLFRASPGRAGIVWWEGGASANDIAGFLVSVEEMWEEDCFAPTGTGCHWLVRIRCKPSAVISTASCNSAPIDHLNIALVGMGMDKGMLLGGGGLLRPGYELLLMQQFFFHLTNAVELLHR